MKRIVQIAFAGLISVMVSMVSVGAYPLAWAGTLSCCCGEHGADDACGCPSCPATETGDDEQVQETRLRSCGGSAMVAPGQMIKLIPASETLVVLGAPEVRVSRGLDETESPSAPPIRPEEPDS